MTTTYNKSLSSDFGGDLNPTKLQSEIEADEGIGPTCIVVSNVGDNVDIVFDSALNGGEQTSLDTLITNHTSTTAKLKEVFYSIDVDKEVTTPVYKRTSIFKYGGSDTIGTIDYIEIISCKDSNVPSYDARIIDKTNNAIICEKTTMTNTEVEIQDFGTLSNIPSSQAVFELQVKKNGGNSEDVVLVDEIIIYHGNN